MQIADSQQVEQNKTNPKWNRKRQKKTNTRKKQLVLHDNSSHPQKQFSSVTGRTDFLPFVPMQDLSSLLKHAPAQCAVCYTTYMLFFYLQKVCISFPWGNNFCLNTYLQITKNTASVLKTTNCCNNSKLYL